MNHEKIIESIFKRKFVECVQKNKDFWNYYNLAWNSVLPIEFILDNKNLPWRTSPPYNFEFLSYHPCITLDILEKYPYEEYDWKYLLYRFGKDKEKIYKLKDKLKDIDINYYDKVVLIMCENMYANSKCTYNELINLEFKNFLNNKSCLINIIDLYFNKHMNKNSIDFIRFKDIPNLNKNLSDEISSHSFVFDYYIIKLSYYTSIIQIWWRYKILLNPNHKIGNKYIVNKYNRI